MGLNTWSMSESLAVCLALKWKILWSFLILLSKTNIVLTLKSLNLLNNSFNLFLITGLALQSVVILEQKDSKFQHYSDIHNY